MPLSLLISHVSWEFGTHWVLNFNTLAIGYSVGSESKSEILSPMGIELVKNKNLLSKNRKFTGKLIRKMECRTAP